MTQTSTSILLIFGKMRIITGLLLRYRLYQIDILSKIWNQRATLRKDHNSNNQFTCKCLFFYKIPGCDLYHSNLAAHKFSLMQTLILGGDPLTVHCILPAELT